MAIGKKVMSWARGLGLGVKVCAAILLAILAFSVSQSLSGPTSIKTPTGASAQQTTNLLSNNHGSLAGLAYADDDDFDTNGSQNNPDSNGYTENPSGIKEIESIQIKACPTIAARAQSLPVALRNKVELCTPDEEQLWNRIIELGAGTPRSEQLRLANTGSLISASQYLPVMNWSSEVGNFNTAPDLKGMTFSTLLPALLGFIATLCATVVGYAWMVLMFLVTLGFTADIAARAMHFIDFMVAWMGSLFTSSNGNVIAVLAALTFLSLLVHLLSLIFPATGRKFIGTRLGRVERANNVREVVISFALSLGALAMFIFIASQAQKNHLMDSHGAISALSSSESSAIAKYVEDQRQQDEFADEISDPDGLKTVDIANRISADVPVSVLKEPSNWAVMSPGWIIGNLFRGINWATQAIATVPLQLSQAMNPDPTRTSDDLDTCGVYIDGKRGLFLATPAAHNYEMASNLLVGMDMLFQRMVLEPYSVAAFGGGSSGKSVYCRALDSAAGTTTGTQVLAMRASGLYGAIVGTGGMGTVGGEGSNAIVAPGNPWKTVDVQASNGTLLGSDGYPIMLTMYDQYKTTEAEKEDQSVLQRARGALSSALGAVKNLGGGLVNKVLPDNRATNAAKALASGDPTGALLSALGGKTEEIGDERFVDSVQKTVDIGGEDVKYSSSMTALQRVFGPGVVNEDAQFEAQAYFAACRPVVGTTNMRLAAAWNGVEAAEPTTGDAPPLTEQDCVNDAIIGPYTNGGFGGGSENDENKIEASSPQKKFLYKPRDADGRRTVLFGFSFGADGDDRSSLQRLSRDADNGGSEAKDFYQASTGTYTTATLVTVVVMVVGIWVIYKYILKMLVGALFSGFLLVGAALMFFGTLALMVFPIKSIRRWFRTAFFSVLSSAMATSLVALLLLLIIACSRTFEFMLSGALSYAFDMSGTFSSIIEPMVVLVTVVAAAVMIEKITKKVLGGPSISSWDSVGAISGMALQPLRSGLDGSHGTPLFSGYNGRALADLGRKGRDKYDKAAETVMDTKENTVDGRRKAADLYQSKFGNDGDPQDPNSSDTTDPAETAEQKHEEAKRDAEETVNRAKGESGDGDSDGDSDGDGIPDASDTTDNGDSPTSAEQKKYAEEMGGNGDFNPTEGLEPNAPLSGGADGVTQRDAAAASGVLPSPATSPVDSARADDIRNRADQSGTAPSRSDLGRNGWNNINIEPDFSASTAQFQAALNQYVQGMQSSVDQTTQQFSDSLTEAGSQLSRMAGGISVDTSRATAGIQEAVNSFGRNLGTTVNELGSSASSSINELLDPQQLSRTIGNARANSAAIRQAMQSEMASTMAPAIRMYQEHAARQIAEETSRAIADSQERLASTVARPLGAATARAIDEAIRRRR